MLATALPISRFDVHFKLFQFHGRVETLSVSVLYCLHVTTFFPCKRNAKTGSLQYRMQSGLETKGGFIKQCFFAAEVLQGGSLGSITKVLDFKNFVL